MNHDAVTGVTVAAVTIGCLLLMLLELLVVNPRRRRRRSQEQELLYTWLADIAKDARHPTLALLEHVKHHADEGVTEGVSQEWLASMWNLFTIIQLREKLTLPTRRMCLERLHLHWQKDPVNMTPPPHLHWAIEKLVAAAPAPTPEEERVRAVSDPKHPDYRTWHGS